MNENEVKKEVNPESNNNDSSLGGGSIIFGLIFGGLIGLFIAWVLEVAVLSWLFDGTPTWLYVVCVIFGGLIMCGNLAADKEKQVKEQERIDREKEQLELLKKLNEKK